MAAAYRGYPLRRGLGLPEPAAEEVVEQQGYGGDRPGDGVAGHDHRQGVVDGQDAYDYTAIVFLYLAGTELHLYWKTRRRGSALLAAACGLVCAGNLAMLLLG